MIGAKTGIYSQSAGGAYNFGNALEFDGVDDFANLAFAMNTTEFTISLWFNLPTAPSFERILGGANLTDWIDIRSSVLINVRLPLASGNFTVPSIVTNTWYHLLVARNSSNQVRLFLNGVESSSGVLNIAGNCTYQTLGRQTGGSFAHVTLDDCLFNSSYGDPATEAASIYNDGAGADPLSVIPTAEQLYRFNGNPNNDGSLGGSATLNNFVANPYVPHT